MPETEDQSTKELTVAADPAGYDRAGLEANVSDKMASVFKDGDDTLSGEEEVKITGKPSEEAEKPVAEQEVSTETESAEKEAAAESQAKPTTPATPATVSTVPAAYRRSLKAYQWTDEEIDQAAKANPDGFLKTAEKIHLNRVNETQRWAEMGRAANQKTPEVTPTAPAKLDTKALRDKYGDEPFIAAMEAQEARLAAADAFISQSRERQAQSEMATLAKSIDDYFGGKDLADYHDHYGKSGRTLTEKQLSERQKVLETADLLISGARSMGRSMTLEEALTMSHDSVSSPIAAKVAVKKIETQVRTRQAALSLRPGSRGNTPAPETRKELEKKVGAGLAKAFGK